MGKKRKKSRLLGNIKYFFLHNIAAPLIALSVKLIIMTWRYKWEGLDFYLNELKNREKGLIGCFWHGDMIGILGAAIKLKGNLPITILISPSRDGEILARIVTQLGLKAERGSSSKSPVASLKILKRLLDEKQIVAIAVDGPRGPRHKAKSGAAMLSKSAGAMILPVGVNISRKIGFKSWDKSELPLPFSTVNVTFRECFKVNNDAEKEDIEKNSLKLEQILLEIKKERNINI